MAYTGQLVGVNGYDYVDMLSQFSAAVGRDARPQEYPALMAKWDQSTFDDFHAWAAANYMESPPPIVLREPAGITGTSPVVTRVQTVEPPDHAHSPTPAVLTQAGEVPPAHFTAIEPTPIRRVPSVAKVTSSSTPGTPPGTPKPSAMSTGKKLAIAGAVVGGVWGLVMVFRHHNGRTHVE